MQYFQNALHARDDELCKRCTLYAAFESAVAGRCTMFTGARVPLKRRAQRNKGTSAGCKAVAWAWRLPAGSADVPSMFSCFAAMAEGAMEDGTEEPGCGASCSTCIVRGGRGGRLGCDIGLESACCRARQPAVNSGTLQQKCHSCKV